MNEMYIHFFFRLSRFRFSHGYKQFNGLHLFCESDVGFLFYYFPLIEHLQIFF